MTIIHAFVIVATLAAAVVCAKTQSCHETLPQLITLCTTVVAGTLGNAMGKEQAKSLRGDSLRKTEDK